MSLRPLIALVAVLLLAALGLLWFAQHDSPADRPGAPARSTPAPGDPTIPGDALWIEGRVVWPDGAPTGEEVRVEASGRRLSRDRGAPRTHTVPVEPDGRFRVALGKGTRKGFLDLEARYLFLGGKQKVEPAELEGEVVIRPLLAGRIVGTIAPPPGLEISEEQYAQMHVVVHSWTRVAGTVHRRVSPASDGSFSFSGLPPSSRYQLDLTSPVFVDGERDLVTVAPGEVTEVPITMRRGARVAGRVVDPDGLGLEGVELDADLHVESKRAGFWRYRSVLTGEDGEFALDGLYPGGLELTARGEGFIELRVPVGELEDGAEREDLVLRMRTVPALAGRILWPDGTPAPGAAVLLRQVADEDEIFWIPREFTAQADSNGEFRVAGLGENPLVVSAGAPRNEQAKPGESGPEEGAPDGQLWRREQRDVLPGAEGLTLVLAPGKTLRGRVVDDTGAAVPHYLVTAYAQTGVKGKEYFDWEDPLELEVEAESGEFELTGLLEETWHVTASARDHLNSENRVVTAPSSDLVELRLTRLARLSGVVRDPDGGWATLAQIEVTRGKGEDFTTWRGVVITGDEGRFELSEGPGRLTLYARPSSPSGRSDGLELELTAGEARSNLLLTLHRGARLTGELHPTAQPVAGRRIEVSGRGGLGFYEEATSDEEGRFALESLPPGEFVVRLLPGWEAETDSEWLLWYAQHDEVTATLAEGGEAHVVLGAPPATPIEVCGRVSVGGEVLPGLVVLCVRDGFQAAACCDDGGQYELGVDGPGTYRFSLSAWTPCASSLAREIGEQTGRRQDLDFPVGSVTGRLIDSKGEPAGGVSVVLQGAEANGGDGGSATRAESRDDGTFRFRNVPPGRYSLHAAGPDRLGGKARYASSFVDELIVGTDESPDEVVIELRPGGTIAGKVRRADGTPVENAGIVVKDDRGRDLAAHRISPSDGDGNYCCRGVPAGSFTVSAWTDAGESREVRVEVSVGARSRVDLVIPD